MKFTFIVTTEGMSFIKKYENLFPPIVTCNEKDESITFDIMKPDLCTVGQYMTEIKNRGLFLVQDRNDKPVVMDSKHIVKYPYELEKF